jgi:nucleotide-binding universal stress UspA family protein
MTNTPIPFTHILVPTDGSHPSIQAGRLAVQLAAHHQARITFVYVIDESIAMDLASASGREFQQVQEEMEMSAQRSLDYLSRLALEMEVTSNQVIRHGIPYTEIADLAQEQNVDLIAIGLVESRSPRRSLIGSVTERIIEHSPCPILVVK